MTYRKWTGAEEQAIRKWDAERRYSSKVLADELGVSHQTLKGHIHDMRKRKRL